MYLSSDQSHHTQNQFTGQKRTKKNAKYVYKSSNVKYIFDCDKCPHDFDIGLDTVVAGRW